MHKALSLVAKFPENYLETHFLGSLFWTIYGMFKLRAKDFPNSFFKRALLYYRDVTYLLLARFNWVLMQGLTLFQSTTIFSLEILVQK